MTFTLSSGVTPSFPTFKQILTRLDLLTSLQICLDAGDIASVPTTTPTKWLDTSGNGYDFFLGADGVTATGMPAFVGVPGRCSGDDYFVHYDAAGANSKYFKYDAANETFMNNLHKDNAVWTCIHIGWMEDLTLNYALFGTGGNVGTNVGCHIRTAWSSGNIQFQSQNGTASQNFNSSALGIYTHRWMMNSVAYDESVGATGITFGLNKTFSQVTSGISSPSAASATYTMEICSRGNFNAGQRAGDKTAIFGMWSGRRLTTTELSLICDALAPRFNYWL